MHLGSIKTAGTFANKNFKYIVLNNNSHDSVGGQPTVGFKVDFSTMAQAANYKYVFVATNDNELILHLNKLRKIKKIQKKH